MKTKLQRQLDEHNFCRHCGRPLERNRRRIKDGGYDPTTGREVERYAIYKSCPIALNPGFRIVFDLSMDYLNHDDFAVEYPERTPALLPPPSKLHRI